jgi:GTPase SAR1 family protein
MTNPINLQDFDKKKEFVLSSIQEVIQTSNELHAIEAYQYLKETKQQLEKESFMLTVVGEFSRGKSTFINALLGKNVLPSKVKPTTAMINKIYFNEVPSYSLLFRSPDEPKKIIDEREFRKLCAPREADEDDQEDVERYEEELQLFKRVSMAEIGYPNHFCKAGIEIYDTPGTNDIDEAREEITFSFVPKSDAVIFLLSATTPFGSSEMEFLKDRILNEHINKVFFVINFKDRLQSKEEEEKVVKYIREKLQPLLPNPKLYLVSSLDALTIRRLENNEEFRIKSQVYTNLEDTGLSSLETDLSHFFQYEKGQAKLEKPVRRLVKKINEITTETIALRVAASNMEMEEIDKKINELKPQVDRFKKNARGIIENLLLDLQNEESTLTKNVESQLRTMSDNLSNSLDRYTGSLEENEVKRFLQNQTKTHQNKIQTEMNELKKKIIEQHVSNAYKLLNTEEQDLNKAVQETFNLKLEMNYNFDLSLYQNDDDIFGMVMGAAGLGLGALILAPALLVVGGIGAAIGAFFFGDSIADAFTDYRRNKKINEIKKQMQQSLYNSREEVVSQFRREWINLIRQIEMTFEGEVHQKTMRLEEDLHQVRMEKETEKRSVEEQRKYYESLGDRLKMIQQNVLNVIE